MPDSKRRLTQRLIQRDIEALNGLNAVPDYQTNRAEATPTALQLAYQKMLTQQQLETERLALYRAAVDATQQAELEFHNAVLAMKEVIRGQFGSDSDAARAVGLKKKSDRKRPVRSKETAIAS